MITLSMTTTEDEISRIELRDIHNLIGSQSPKQNAIPPIDVYEPVDAPGPATLSSAKAPQKWNQPRSNMWRTFATFCSYLVLGFAASAYGIESYYNLTYATVALVFLMPFPGYLLAAVTTHLIHQRLGQRGIAIIGCISHIFTFLVIALHPPFPVVLTMFVIQGFGYGIIASAWNAWAANIANAHEIMGFLHGFFGLGGVLCPLIATTMVTKGELQWYTFYWIMVALSIVETFLAVTAFWKSTGAAFQAAHTESTMTASNSRGPLREAVLARPNARVSWLLAILLWIYLGVEISLGGWIVTFMLRERHGSTFASGLTATGFWLGMTVGRLILGFVTPRIGERWAIVVRDMLRNVVHQIYLVLSTILQLIFWLVPSFVVSAIAVAFQGFFLGPVFPSAIVIATRLLPKHLHVTTISFVSAVGSSGGAAWPFVVGAVAQTKGVNTLQPIILAGLVSMCVVWVGMPRTRGRKDE